MISLHVPRRRPDATARLEALIGLPREPSSCASLLEAAEDPYLQVARAALARLAELGGPEEARVLRERLLDADLALIPAIATTLRALRDERIVELAREGLRDEVLSRRLAAALTLRELADDATSPALVSALRDPIAAVRRSALDALAALSPSCAGENECARMLSDHDSSVRAAAVRALLRLSREPQRHLRGRLTDAGKNVRLELARACAVLDDEMVHALMDDIEPDVREHVAWALVEAPRETLVPSLVAALADPDWSVRRAAARALGAAGEASAATPLIDALVDAHALVRAAALRSLQDLFGRRPRAALP